SADGLGSASAATHPETLSRVYGFMRETVRNVTAGSRHHHKPPTISVHYPNATLNHAEPTIVALFARPHRAGIRTGGPVVAFTGRLPPWMAAAERYMDVLERAGESDHRPARFNHQTRTRVFEEVPTSS